MTKADIVNEIAQQTGVEKVEALAVVEAFMETVKASLTTRVLLLRSAIVRSKLSSLYFALISMRSVSLLSNAAKSIRLMQ